MVEWLLCKQEALNSNPSPTKKIHDMLIIGYSYQPHLEDTGYALPFMYSPPFL
jgi:hypothetical protein